jgi:hypothetical protein
LAPARLQSDLTDRVMIAWDESPECWHAVSAAIPFMQLAKSVRVISVDRDADSRKASQAEVLAYLRCHGIAGAAQVVAPELRSVGDTLLAAGAAYRQRRSSNANSLRAHNSAESPQICATFQRDNLRRHF